MLSASPPLLFNVTRREPKLVVPSKPTPREFKPLSDIDDHQALKFQVQLLFFYENNPSMAKTDPVKLIRRALAEALVFYYPFAGRLFEGPNKKLVVDCTSELGVPFVEADADVRIHQVLDMIETEFGCEVPEELFHNVSGSDGIIGCPLLHFQVTRFSCGGFTLAVGLNHTVADAFGIVQLLNATAELARGVNLSVTPVWEREYFLTGRQPPKITCQHIEFEEVDDISPEAMASTVGNNLIRRLFLFGPNDIETLRDHLPKQKHKLYSSYNVLAACLWRCRTRALELNPDQTVRFGCVSSGRFLQDLKVPHGYYGNVFAYPCVQAKSGILCSRPLEYAADLIKEAKAKISGEYLRSMADFMVINEKPFIDMKWIFCISDNRNVGFDGIDFGWGKPLFAGPATSYIFPVSFLTRIRGGIVVPLSMPETALERFQEELKKMLVK